MPDWFQVIQVARFLGCTPWALLEQADIWLEWGAIALNVQVAVDKGPQVSDG